MDFRYIEMLTECFPPILKIILNDYIKKENCEEIHISRGKKVFLRLSASVFVLDYICLSSDFDLILKNICRGSLYAHSESIKKGYISFMDSIRIGVTGRAVSEKDRILSVSKIDSINIRIPHYPKDIGSAVVAVLEHFSFESGVLIYSPPGVGKTTVLRDTARILTSAPYYKRVCLMDTRGELDFPEKEGAITLDAYRFYPPEVAIESAIRTMSPELIICDEIGKNEREAILYSANKGVPIVATAHGGDLESLLSGEDMGELHKKGVFACYIGLKRGKDMPLHFEYHLAKDINLDKSQ